MVVGVGVVTGARARPDIGVTDDVHGVFSGVGAIAGVCGVGADICAGPGVVNVDVGGEGEGDSVGIGFGAVTDAGVGVGVGICLGVAVAVSVAVGGRTEPHVGTGTLLVHFS